MEAKLREMGSAELFTTDVGQGQGHNFNPPCLEFPSCPLRFFCVAQTACAVLACVWPSVTAIPAACRWFKRLHGSIGLRLMDLACQDKPIILACVQHLQHISILC